MQVKEGKHLIIDRHEGEQVVIGDPKNPIGIVEVGIGRGQVFTGTLKWDITSRIGKARLG